MPTLIPTTLFGQNEFSDDCKVVGVYGGLGQFAAITNTGDLYIWGRNRFGSLGLGHLENQFFPLKVKKNLKELPTKTALYSFKF
jgi:alpha-tubulin suppressor-like RCC1 family protein